MGVIGNTIGEVRYVDLPITAGAAPTVSWTTDEVLDLIGVEVLAAGATAATLKVNAVEVPAGDIATFADNRGSAHAAAPAGSVPLFTGTEGAHQSNQKQGAGLYANWQSSGTVQSGITDRTGSVPAPAALAPLDAAIPAATAVEVDLTGTVTVLDTLPAADGNGFITMPVGNVQSGITDEPYDNVPFRVKASDTTLDSFAGVVRLVFQVPFSDPNAAAKTAGTYPNNGVQKGSGY